jgi:hypothetical protein
MADHEPRRQRISEPGPSHDEAPPLVLPGKQPSISAAASDASAEAPRPSGARRSSPRTPEEERRFIELFGGAPEASWTPTSLLAAPAGADPHELPQSRLEAPASADPHELPRCELAAPAGADPHALPWLDLRARSAGSPRAAKADAGGWGGGPSLLESKARPRAAGAEQAKRSAVNPELERQLLDYLAHGVAPAVQFENLLFLGLDPDAAIELQARLSADPPPRADRLATAFRARLSAADRQSILARLATFNLASRGERMWSELAPGEESQAIQLVSRVDAPKGVYLRGQPAGPKNGPWLPFDTLVSVTRKTERGWYWVTSLGDDRHRAAPTGVSGFLEDYHVASKMPEPTAHLYEVKPNDLLKDIAAHYYEHGFKWGHDARVYVQAIYHANQDRDVVFRHHAELGVDRSALSTTNLHEALVLWKSSRVVAGQALWIPSEAFVLRLKAAGVIDQASISKTLWDTTGGAVESMIDRAQHAGGFAVGLLEGAWSALEDLLTGAVDVIKGLWLVLKGIFTDFAELLELAGKLGAAWANRSELLTAFATNFMAKWESKDDWERGSFQGEVVGYLTALMFLIYVTAGAGAAIAGSGRFGSFIKVIQLADAAGSIGTYVRKLRAVTKLPQQLTDAATHALGKKITKPASASGGSGGGQAGSGHTGAPHASHSQAPSSQTPRSPDPHGPSSPDGPAVRNHGEPYGDPRVHPEEPHRYLEKHELVPTSQLKFATTWKQAIKLLGKEYGVPIGRKLHAAAEGHDVVARLARGDASALKQLGIDDVPRKLDTTGREWALIETRDGFAVVVGRYGSAELPAGTRALAHSHPGTKPAHPLEVGETPMIDLSVPKGGRTYVEILEDFTAAKKAGITPSARDIHAISDGGEHVIYTRFVHHGGGKIGNPVIGDTAARVNLHLGGAQVARFNQRTQEYWYKVHLHVKDSTGKSLWSGDVYAYWTPNDHHLLRVQVERPAIIDRAPAGGWQRP